MKKVLLLIISFCFIGNVYALDLKDNDYVSLSNFYHLIERIENEEKEEKKGSFFEYVLLIGAFVGVSAVFLFLKDSGEE